jgi:hypothetical protein
MNPKDTKSFHRSTILLTELFFILFLPAVLVYAAGPLSFAPAVNYGAGTGSSSVAISDFNGDGTFAAAVNYSAGDGPRSEAVGDFNRDGKPDLAVANWTSDNVSVLLGNGNGTFAAAVSYGVDTAPVP